MKPVFTLDGIGGRGGKYPMVYTKILAQGPLSELNVEYGPSDLPCWLSIVPKMDDQQSCSFDCGALQESVGFLFFILDSRCNTYKVYRILPNLS